MANSNTTRRVDAAVRAVLPRSVKVRVRERDAVVDLTINGVPVDVKWIGEGGLRQVRELLAHRRTRPGIFVARRMSPGAREALSEAGVGWIDETGAAEIVQDSLIISKRGHPDEPRERPPRWTLSVLAVAEALLCDTKATVAATQEATGLSAGSCPPHRELGPASRCIRGGRNDYGTGDLPHRRCDMARHGFRPDRYGTAMGEGRCSLVRHRCGGGVGDRSLPIVSQRC